MPKKPDPFEKGRADFLKEKSLADNPYDIAENDHLRWQDGWHSAEEAKTDEAPT